MGNSGSRSSNNRKITSLLKKIGSQTNLYCDDKCQERKKLRKLENDYNKARHQLNTSPSKYNDAYRSYIDFKNGPGTYAAMKKAKDDRILEEKKQAVYDDFTIKLNNAYTQLNSLMQLQQYDDHGNELVHIEKVLNDTLDTEIKNATDNKNTENRFSYYQNKDLERNFSIIKYLKGVYFVVLAVLVLYFILFKGNGSKKMYMLSAALLIYPFVIKWLYDYLIKGYKFISYMFEEIKK